jgi:hypothetical protein
MYTQGVCLRKAQGPDKRSYPVNGWHYYIILFVTGAIIMSASRKGFATWGYIGIAWEYSEEIKSFMPLPWVWWRPMA